MLNEIEMLLACWGESKTDENKRISAATCQRRHIAHPCMTGIWATHPLELLHQDSRSGARRPDQGHARRWQRVEAQAWRAVAEGQARRDPRREAHGLSVLGYICIGLGEPDEALGWLERARDLALQEGDTRGAAISWSGIADVYYLQGKLRDALDIRLRRELPALRQLGAERDQAVVWGQIADICSLQGKLRQAVQIRRQRELPILERLGDLRSAARTWGQIADMYYLQGKLDQTIEIYDEQVIPVLTRLRASHDLLVRQAYLGVYLWKRNQEHDQGRALYLMRRARIQASSVGQGTANQIDGIVRHLGIDAAPTHSYAAA